jgi:hypothetical protein
MKKTLCTTASLSLLAVSLLAAPGAYAFNEARDVVAPYARFGLGIGSASGPLDTHYLVSNTSGTDTVVNVKCYNDGGSRVGPAGGTNINLGSGVDKDMDVTSPSGLGLTSHPNYTGLGWCYFSHVSGDDFAVSYIIGVSQNGNLITSNNPVGLMSDTAVSQITDDDANIPYWTDESSWNTYFLALNPTSTGRTFQTQFYRENATLIGTWTGEGILGGRDLDFAAVHNAVPATAGGWGFADVDIDPSTSSARPGFVGWIVGFNPTTGQAFMYAVPLDVDDVVQLGPSDRP